MSRTSRVMPLPVVLSGALLLVCGCSGRVAAPTSYESYNAKDGAFACQCPAGWDVTGGGRGGYHSCKFKSGGASIKVISDVAGSLMGDIVGSRNQSMGMDDEVEPPVAEIHEMGQREMADELGNYQEQAAQPVRTSLGEGRQSEFTASSTFGAKLHGYRATVLSNDRRITVVCKCPEKDWETLQAAFNEVIGSLKHGQTEL